MMVRQFAKCNSYFIGQTSWGLPPLLDKVTNYESRPEWAEASEIFIFVYIYIETGMRK